MLKEFQKIHTPELWPLRILGPVFIFYLQRTDSAKMLGLDRIIMELPTGFYGQVRVALGCERTGHSYPVRFRRRLVKGPALDTPSI